MHNLSAGIRALGVVALACLLAPSWARAQEIKPASRPTGQAAPGRPADVQPAVRNEPSDLHRMEIYNGWARTVHYFSAGMSSSDRAVLRDLGQAESSLSVVNELQALRNQYLVNERALQAQRRTAQEWNYAPAYYGYSAGYAGIGGPDLTGFGAPNAYFGYNNFGYNNFPYVWGALPITAGYLDPPATPLQQQLAHALAEQTNPEYAAKVRRDYDAAFARASDSPALAKGLGIRKGDVAPVKRELDAPQPGQAVVTMKDGRAFSGTLVREDNDRLVLDTGKAELEIRKNETTTIVKGKAGK